ncbi:integral membrane protein [Cryptococcus neoformans]|uniref:Integral membrane protein n=2 Tax=Cryptococcus neoformans TaxID=5207 RepID=A0A854QKI5_CRYNE|nr:integral membrane protein [Cryptococcus neoformans var. grubii H99]AUB22788.1 integral membrane protein [Cryptococcus neoformans var. grubii]OWT42051.1 integral membrane protein [Cryptococcus neoformans var. grubii Bt1]OWZ35492.1 integral membrane protein [Cryptococcus neoformans var. grubii AD2-60a]OWZ47371.1 integral membrane protein [Cryptococcus neoformans var. grubii C23]OWZ51744.1 integral membrane protein [Cryptococcus neoformans var. grubii AD1-83a]OWZ56953.1 integral membrane prot|eukprot:XP_012047439.1 integral membrane protein [Cryptococcus neoformans var. grubii H99]
MKENYAVENALGTIGAVLWMIQNIPQVIKSYREKSTKGLSASLMFIWALGTVIHGAYIIAQNFSIPLQVQPQVFAALATVSWCQCLHYGKGYSVKSVWAIFIVLCGIFAGFEVGSVYALWAGHRNGVEWPTLMYGYLSAVLLALGLLPQYWEIYKYREVIGISILFMAIDILGGVFSFLSLLFRKDLDIAGFVSYALVVVLDGIIVALYFILNPIAKRRRAREAEKQRPGDEAGIEGGLNTRVSRSPTLIAHGFTVEKQNTR